MIREKCGGLVEMHMQQDLGHFPVDEIEAK
jgi:hypothetical protein